MFVLHMSDTKEQNALESVRLSRMIVPILLGLGVVGYLMYTNLDLDELKGITWDGGVFFWLALAVMTYVVRHMFYSWRLKVLSEDLFSWKKSMKLIVLWEFASAVSPSAVGGSGLALYFLSREKMKTAKVFSIVLYSMVLDTMFFVLLIPIALIFLGPSMIRPGLESFAATDGFMYTFYSVMAFMVVSGSFFFYGLFINPHSIGGFIRLVANISFMKRWKSRLLATAEEIVISARELRSRDRTFYIKTILSTIGAWMTRFLAINFIIAAFSQVDVLGIYDQIMMLMRGVSMHIITSVSPTPGSSGVAEYLFGGFYTEYVSSGIATLLALVWRVITYYCYLLIGAIIIPVWIAEVLKSKKQSKVAE